MEVGNKVKFSDRFIKSVQGHELAPLRGKVVEIKPGKMGLSGKASPDRAVVDWGDEEGESTSLVKNLTVVK